MEIAKSKAKVDESLKKSTTASAEPTGWGFLET